MPSKSAFDVLLSKSKVCNADSKTSRKRSSGQFSTNDPARRISKTPKGESAFSNCPICGNQVIKALLQQHAHSCLSAHSLQADSGAQSPTSPSLISQAPGQDAATSDEPTPIIQNRFTETESTSCTPSREASSLTHAWPQKGPIHVSPDGDLTTPSSVSLPGYSAASRDCEPSALAAELSPSMRGEINAFDAMFTAQRHLSQAHHFFLGRTHSGSWHWLWKLKVPGASNCSQQPPDKTATSADSKTGQNPPFTKSVWTTNSQVSFAAGSKSNLKLLTNVPPDDGGKVEWDNCDLASNTSAPRWHGGLGPLKSALQKNIRLCRAHSAVRVALYLIKDNASEFLRRLAIIVMEDATAHPAYPALVWLLAAHAKGYSLGRSHVDLLLAIVQQVATVPVKDNLPSAPTADSSPPGQAADRSQASVSQGRKPDVASGNPSDTVLAVIDEALPPEAAAIVKAMRLRASYGGMQGDQALLRMYADRWQSRFAGEQGAAPALPAPAATFTTASPAKSNTALLGVDASQSWMQYISDVHTLNCGDPVDVRSVGPMTRGDIPLSAIDFHCSTISDDLQQEPQIRDAAAAAVAADADGLLDGVDDAFRSAMWIFRSGVNRRKQQTECGTGGQVDCKEALLETLWAVAAGPVDVWSQNFIRKRLY